MEKLKKQGLVFILIALFLISIVLPVIANAEPANPLSIKAAAALLVDAQSGKILYQNNIDQPLHPASMTKMMTEYLVLDAIDQGKIKWDQKISISDYVFKVSQNNTLSNVYLRKDEQYSVKELYESMAIYSANGSTIALAELVAGSETNFVKMMNDKAKEFGLKDDTKFVNCTGLNNSDLFGMQPAGTSPTEENTMSARSVATLAFRLLHDHPEVLQTSSIPVKMFRDGTPDVNKMDNWNWMLPGSLYPILDYQGVDGIKTGSTDLGGFSFTATAKRNNMRLLSVVMKTSDKIARFNETKKLLDYGFTNYSEKEIVPAGYSLPNQAEVPVVNGKQKKVGVASQGPLSILIKNGDEKAYEPSYVLNNSMVKNGALVAPLGKDQAVGTLTLNYKGAEKYEYLTNDGKAQEQVPLVAVSEVKKAGWLTMLFRGIGGLFSGIFKK